VDHKEIATYCKALGDPTRARIFQFLLDCCCGVAVDEQGGVAPTDGPTAGEICCHITGSETVTSTISFHLKELREAKLITVEKQGKYMKCTINRDTLARLAEFFGTAASASAATCCSPKPKEKNNG
jgi:ArsR family transcriptional regulator, arsenate/arsenite/antimonite-responsive transcriptional repressor